MDVRQPQTQSASSRGTSEARRTAVYRVSIVGMVVNVLLTVAKFAAGILGRSTAMIADAVHSVSDVATDVVVIVFLRVSMRPRDTSHDYGHGKFETLATVAIAAALAAVAVGILINAVKSIAAFASGTVLSQPGSVALIAAAVSLVVKELLFRYTRKVGSRQRSPAVIANAWHHRTDALSSIGALAGIGGAIFLGERWRVLDPIAAIVVSVLIGKAAVEMIIPGLNELLEASLPPETEREIMAIVRSVHGVRDPHSLKTRKIGAEIAIEIHVRVDSAMTVEASHNITEEVERELEMRFGPGTLVTVHVEPPSDREPGP